ncbi:seryl-tRNA synthetase [Plasmodium vivax India VII]|uniref:serine--tRNA ligase n=3 Tax=Plasmodium vivax TaxID=5855 RepID=A0A0J9T429_PLAVI|nr:seryl-tRNA synthetase [Plasmodium vivax India VII]KMZ90200.1 seryl-tRNA synthetase [Plasmodium vivax Mauritania I]CAI7723504.1 serine--tRNA ligase, putative [Plasmodium vivax]SCO69921.1 serine--tRNA ligase, putative [Plasmodium vivax]
MHMKAPPLLCLLLCVHWVLGRRNKHGIESYINLWHGDPQWRDPHAVKRRTPLVCKNKRIEAEHGECGMSLNILKTNENKVIENLKKRGMEKNINNVQMLKDLIEEKNQLEMLRNNLRNRRKVLSDRVKKLLFAQNATVASAPQGGMSEGTPCMDSREVKMERRHPQKDPHFEERNVEQVKKEINQINEQININETKITHLRNKIEEHFSRLPNLLLSKVPEGKTHNGNKVVKMYKMKEVQMDKSNTSIEPHEEILKKFDNNQHIFDNITNKIGFGYNVLVNNIAKLERALIHFMINTHVNKFQYTYVKAPVIVARSALTNTGQLPKFENDLFKINNNYKILNEEAFLIPTSEVSLLNLFRNAHLDSENLPIRLVSHSSCFRIEKNFTYGKASKGLLREHIFEKVELVNITDRKTSHLFYKNLIKHSEYILKKLKIPYRVVLLNSFETPFSASICYDLEAWLPSQQRFVEVSSCSNCLDFQARKLNLKYKKKDSNFFCHTINGSGLAVGRVLAIILEQYQMGGTSPNEKKQLIIPKPLRKFMNASVISL